eukprot:scaffold128966_cov33-Phaeocystis_antarctica.AAC.1
MSAHQLRSRIFSHAGGAPSASPAAPPPPLLPAGPLPPLLPLPLLLPAPARRGVGGLTIGVSGLLRRGGGSGGSRLSREGEPEHPELI